MSALIETQLVDANAGNAELKALIAVAEAAAMPGSDSVRQWLEENASLVPEADRERLVSEGMEGIREAGGIAMEFPVHPIQETGKRPTAALDRNLAYLGLVELLFGYPLDGVVLTTGCDKTTPACMMAAATVNLPAIVLSGGPMLNGWFNGVRTGSGTVV